MLLETLTFLSLGGAVSSLITAAVTLDLLVVVPVVLVAFVVGLFLPRGQQRPSLPAAPDADLKSGIKPDLQTVDSKAAPGAEAASLTASLQRRLDEETRLRKNAEVELERLKKVPPHASAKQANSAPPPAATSPAATAAALAHLDEEIKKRDKLLHDKKASNGKLKGEVKQLQSEVQRLKLEKEQVSKKLDAKPKADVSLQRELNEASKLATRLREENATLKKALKQAEVTRAAAPSQPPPKAAEPASAADEAAEQASRLLAELRGRIDALEANEVGLKKSLTDAQAALSEAQNKRAEAESARTAAELQVAKLTTQYKDTKKLYVQFRLQSRNNHRAFLITRGQLRITEEKLRAAQAGYEPPEHFDASIRGINEALVALDLKRARYDKLQSEADRAQHLEKEIEVLRAQLGASPDQALSTAHAQQETLRAQGATLRSQLDTETKRADAERAKAQALAERADAEAKRADAEAKRAADVSAQLADARKQADAAKAQAERAQTLASAQANAAKALDAAQTQLKSTQAELEAAKAQAQSTQSAQADAVKALDAAKAQALAAKAEAESAKSLLKSAQAEADAAKSQALAAKTEAESARAEMDAVQARAKSVRAEADAAKAQADAARAEADAAKAQAAVAPAQQPPADLQEKLSRLEQRVESLKEANRTLRKEAAAAQERLAELQTSPPPASQPDTSAAELDAARKQASDAEAARLQAEQRIAALEAQLATQSDLLLGASAQADQGDQGDKEHKEAEKLQPLQAELEHLRERYDALKESQRTIRKEAGAAQERVATLEAQLAEAQQRAAAAAAAAAPTPAPSPFNTRLGATQERIRTLEAQLEQLREASRFRAQQRTDLVEACKAISELEGELARQHAETPDNSQVIVKPAYALPSGGISDDEIATAIAATLGTGTPVSEDNEDSLDAFWEDMLKT